MAQRQCARLVMIMSVVVRAANASTYYTSCNNARTNGNIRTDGVQQLELQIDAIRMYENQTTSLPTIGEGPLAETTYRLVNVYCYKMNTGNPISYLEVDATKNYASWVYGDNVLTTSFSKIRFDEETQMVYTADYTFATTTFENPNGASPCSGSCALLPDSDVYTAHCVNVSGTITFFAPFGTMANLYDPTQCPGFGEGNGCTAGDNTRRAAFSIDFGNETSIEISKEPGDVLWKAFKGQSKPNGFASRLSGASEIFGSKRSAELVIDPFDTPFGCSYFAGVAAGEGLQYFLPEARSSTAEYETDPGFPKPMVYDIMKLRGVGDGTEPEDDYSKIQTLLSSTSEDVDVPLYTDITTSGLVGFNPNRLGFSSRSYEGFETYVRKGGWGLPLCFDLDDAQNEFIDGKAGVKKCSGAADQCLPVNCLTKADSWLMKTYSLSETRYTNILAISDREVPTVEFGQKTEFYTDNMFTKCTDDAPYELSPPTLTTDRVCGTTTTTTTTSTKSVRRVPARSSSLKKTKGVYPFTTQVGIIAGTAAGVAFVVGGALYFRTV